MFNGFTLCPERVQTCGFYLKQNKKLHPDIKQISFFYFSLNTWSSCRIWYSKSFFFRRLGRDKNSSVQKCNKVSISLFPIPFIRYEVFALRYFLRARVRVFGITILNTRIQKPAYSEFEWITPKVKLEYFSLNMRD